jgi:1-acyl-sn-glycerol-3-phosphate acyltransferase
MQTPLRLRTAFVLGTPLARPGARVCLSTSPPFAPPAAPHVAVPRVAVRRSPARHAAPRASSSPPAGPATEKGEAPRSSPFAVLLGTTTLLVSIPVLLAMVVLHPAVLLFDRARRRAHVSLALLWLRMSFALARVHVQVSGSELLPPRDTPVLFVANCQSPIDMFALASVRRGMRFMMPQTAMRAPFIGWVMRFAAWVGVGGAGRREQVKSLQDATAVLSDGGSMVMFPEGRVSKDGTVGKFSAAAFRAAKKAGAVCVPVTVSGTGQMFETGDGGERGAIPTARPTGGIKVTVHASIPPGAGTDAEIAELAERAVRSAIPADPW